MSTWAEFWNQKTSAGHREAPNYLRRHAAELKVLFDGLEPSTVLDIGCGNGVLYEALDFNQVKYKGVDFSPAMLDAFRAKHPGLDLTCEDGSVYRDDRHYDLIFSSQMVQYFDRPQLSRFFGNVRSMMHSRSVFVIASTPCLPHLAGYMSGRLSPPYKRSLRGAALSLAATAFAWRGSMGNWFSPADFVAIAAEHDFSCEIFGSLLYLYRMHAVLRPLPGVL